MKKRRTTTQVATLFLMTLLAIATSACSLRKFVAGRVASAVSSNGPSPLESNQDVDLAVESIPPFLIFFEGLLEEVPKHRGLLTQLAQGYTSYTYLGVQQSLDRAKDTDYRTADKLRARAKWLYLRANQYGFRGLDVSHRGFAAAFKAKHA